MNNADFKARIAEKMKRPTAPPPQPGTEARRLYELETARPYLVIALEILKRAGSKQSADKVRSALKSYDREIRKESRLVAEQAKGSISKLFQRLRQEANG